MHDIVLIPGDGVGPELTREVVRCVEASGVSCNWIEMNAGAKVAETEGEALPRRVLEAIQTTKRALKGPVATPLGGGMRSVNVALRQELSLYACVRPCKAFAGVQTRFPETDIVIIRENTEDVYAGVEFEANSADALEVIACINKKSKKQIDPRSGLSIKAMTEAASARIARYAFEYAKTHGRKKVTTVTKSNIMKFSDGIFMREAQKAAEAYPGITHEHVLVDALCMKMVQGYEFDVLLLPNLYGDIISDLGAGLAGGLGMAPGANIGEHATVYEATHGAAPEFAGKNVLNPSALLLSAAMMLRDMGEKRAADIIENAVMQVVRAGRFVTFDLLPKAEQHRAVSTTRMADAIIAAMNTQKQ